MIYFELVMTMVLVSVLGIVTITDCKRGIIPNKVIILSGITLIVLDFIYYLVFNSDSILIFFTNFMGMSIFAILFYWYGVWAAGDSKLLIIVALGIPARVFQIGAGPVPGFKLIIIIFILGFFYIVLESLWLFIKDNHKKSVFRGIQITKKNLTNMMLAYYFMVSASSVINIIIFNILARGRAIERLLFKLPIPK